MSDTSPHHIGIILDGNRRWAKAQGKPTLDGHRAGAERFKEISLELFSRGTKYVTGYVFSNENWKRTEEEVDYLMRLIVRAVELHLDEYHKKGVRIRILGDKAALDKKVRAAIERTEAKTADNTNGTLGLCLNYGGQQEIVHAVRDLVSQGVSADEVTVDAIGKHIYEPDIPNIDLLIRTSGEYRLSGFMLWRAQYAEFAFVDAFWPDFTIAELDTVIDNYYKRERRFGG